MGRRRDTAEPVTCIACGDTIDREDAREYDRYGDRWDRENKRFEYLCIECHRREGHLSRDGLEETLVAVGSGYPSPGAFVAAYYEQLSETIDADDNRE